MVTKSLTHRARLEACLAGKVPDRVPVSLWRHFPVDDQTPGGLAAATSNFQHLFDFDLIKVTPASSFCLKDWGVEDRWTGNSEGTRDYQNRIIHQPEDWEHLSTLDPNRGHLGAQLACLKLLVAEFNEDTPILQTIFSPLSQAKNLIGAEQLLIQMRSNPDALHEGLKTITISTIQFIEQAALTGIAGIFYAVQHAQYSLLSSNEFETFGKHYDLQVLEATQTLWLNLLHLHGEHIMFDQVASYPVAVINWHDRQTPPNLKEGLTRFHGTVCGGLRQWETLALGTSGQVRNEAIDAIYDTGGKRFILGTGCVMPVISPFGNINTARRVVDEIHIGNLETDKAKIL
jgi:uroporphyrinogen decarboxylase